VTLELEQALARLPDAVPEDFAREFQSSTIHHPVPEPFLDRVVAECRKAPARVWHRAMVGLIGTEPFAGLPGSAIPTLLIWGDRDALFSRAEQEALVSMLPIASLRVYRETGHAPHWERPKQVVRDLERYLRSGSS
jgi:pimeloyl-ACP methyl ester carboxylesterase